MEARPFTFNLERLYFLTRIHHSLTSPSCQPTLPGPSETLEGKTPDRSNHHKLVRERPVSSWTSLERMILFAEELEGAAD